MGKFSNGRSLREGAGRYVSLLQPSLEKAESSLWSAPTSIYIPTRNGGMQSCFHLFQAGSKGRKEGEEEEEEVEEVEVSQKEIVSTGDSLPRD